MLTEEIKKQFIKYIKVSFSATISRGKQCENFGSPPHEQQKYRRCLLTEHCYKETQIFSPEEAKQICPFFNPELIETKCCFLQHYIDNTSVEDDYEGRYLKEIGDLIQVKLEVQDNEKEREKLKEQTEISLKNIGIKSEPPTRYEDFQEWMKRTIKNITL